MKFRLPNTIIDEDGAAWFIESIQHQRVQEYTFMDDIRPNFFQPRPYLVCWRPVRKVNIIAQGKDKWEYSTDYANFDFTELHYKKGLHGKMEIRKIIF